MILVIPGHEHVLRPALYRRTLWGSLPETARSYGRGAFASGEQGWEYMLTHVVILHR